MNSKVQENTFTDNITLSPTAVMNVIKKLKPNSASGPDGFPLLLYKKVSTSLAEPLSLLIKSFFFSIGQAQEWLQAIVTPVYKSGLASNAKNYRPKSWRGLLCVKCCVTCATCLSTQQTAAWLFV